MLTGLTIGNFKAFGEPQHIPIRPLTLIFGANSSGKSSIVHSLMLVKHAVETGEWDVRKPSGAESTVDLGGFPHYLHRPRTEEGCEFGFGLPVGRLGEFIRGGWWVTRQSGRRSCNPVNASALCASRERP
ncbi:MAG: AAA family ATPase [Verrucomicrobia bacterium]|nr:AAA family ATPase [Verrucomicrobiota bacterium]